MSCKRRGQEYDHSHRRAGKRWNRKQQQLYLVLDDWDNGLSVRCIDADTLESEEEGAAAPEHGRLPEPALLRLESADVSRPPRADMSLTALGTKMFVLMNHRCALIYDTETAVQSIGPHAPAQMKCAVGITVPVPAAADGGGGGMLFALSYRFADEHHSFHVMSMQQQDRRWNWMALQPPPPTFTSRQLVVSYALHPDSRTIFMTTANRDTPGDPLGTYTFNTRHSEWRWHGRWALPFLDRAYFDSHLDAWVGLHPDGYVCSCQVPSRTASLDQQLDWRLTKDKLVCRDDDWDDDHLGASLTYMGSAKFGLVETMPREGIQLEDCFGDRHGCELRLTVFRLKYNHKGELQITNRRPASSYLVSRHINYFVPFAISM